MRPFALYDVRDVHGFAGAIARQGNLNLTHADLDDLVAYLKRRYQRLSSPVPPIEKALQAGLFVGSDDQG